jgi:hypothetical protein
MVQVSLGCALTEQAKRTEGAAGTEVLVRAITVFRSCLEETGQVELKVTPINGDTVYAEIGGEASTASQKDENGLYGVNPTLVSPAAK